ncbi:YidB family protein [Salinarimonas soli]|uniref:DUF937 domain-containing protein n=1 Tax=Salinarimonas soli TaxID=1638099 RepID=A0A5B2VCB1_9HYPH|nr:YidB family protein [Salinarimonas soli]KAA2236110.1 DUF937 domain-containing protein [Salinarimonas soli]
MNNGFPSMTALLGLLAVAGYQNRDKLAEMVSGAQGGGQGGGMNPRGGMPQGGMSQGGPGGGGMGQGGGLGGLLGGLLGGAGGGLGSLLGGGMNETVDRFRQSGHGEIADSWVAPGPNREIAPHQLEQAIGPDVLSDLQQRTGLSRDELLSRLSRDLPRAIDDHTPHGRIPREDEWR